MDTLETASARTRAADDEVLRLTAIRDRVEGAKERIGRGGLTAGILDAAGVGDWGDAPHQCRSVAFACRLCRSEESLSAFRELVLHIEAHAGKVLHYRPHQGQPSFLLALQRLSELHEFWRQPPSAWRPKTGPAPLQFAHLVRFLLEPEQAESFHRDVFDGSPSSWARLWFGHFSRDFHGDPVHPRPLTMTKRMAYHFLAAPEPFDCIRALRWSQVMGFGGRSWLAKALDLTRISWQLWDPEEEEWWAGVIQWLVTQRGLRRNDVTPVLDYVYSQRYGVPKLNLAPRPDFSLKGRTPGALREKVKEWHADLAQLQSLTEVEFPKSGVRPGRYEAMVGGDVGVWTVDQILTSAALYEEGRAMRHCVATYYQQVERGSFSVWSMKLRRGDLLKRAVTIQVKERRIIQCRGRCNRHPRPEERRVLGRWAGENNLKIEKL